jgi:hypothetical protein
LGTNAWNEGLERFIACNKREAFVQGSARDDAIHSFFSAAWMDCFASLAMTAKPAVSEATQHAAPRYDRTADRCGGIDDSCRLDTRSRSPLAQRLRYAYAGFRD